MRRNHINNNQMAKGTVMFPTLHRTWSEFVQALTRSREPFNPFVWIYRLALAFLEDLELDRLPWRPAIPIVALFLIGGVSVSYFLVFRQSIIEQRWCHASSRRCGWMTAHDFIMMYLTTMTTYSFLRTMLTSPGIHVSKRSQPKRKYDREAEKAMVARFGEFELQPDQSEKQIGKVFVHPCPFSTRCEVCDHLRPPRCHHCKICRCCVLCYDHHCIFINQCIGYNNYRDFFQTTLFVTLGCWYGVFILYKPFYEPVQAYLKLNGGLMAWVQASIKHGRIASDITNLFIMPSLADLWTIATEANHPQLHQTILDIVFPFVFAVGATMALFLGSHVKFVLRATTSLEHKILLDRMFHSLRKRFTDKSVLEEQWVNPFDQGSALRNWSTVLGPNPLFLLLPLPVAIPPPFLPTSSKDI